MPALNTPEQPGHHDLCVAAFDFDGTLTHGDTLLPFLATALGWPRFAWALLRSSPWLVGHALRLVRNDIAKARLFKATLQGVATADVQRWAERWASEQLPGQLRGAQDPTMARLAWHLAAGHCCVMVSASPDIYLELAAEVLGFDGLVCTQMEVESKSLEPQSLEPKGQDLHVGQGSRVAEQLTGRMQTPNCHGQQKVVRLPAWLAERYDPATLANITLYAYGDTSGDKPMLRMAQKAWYRGKPFAD
jgi:phosphatidylglycerophosphatase C